MVSNLNEVALGTDPMNMDSDNDGVNDGLEDSDFDRLNNITELQLQTNPLRADTDGDQFTDKSEVDALSDPRDPTSIPLNFAFSQVTVHNLAAPTIVETSAFVAVSVRNNVAPEAVSKMTVSSVVSVNNSGNP